MTKKMLNSIKREAKAIKNTPKEGIPCWTNHSIIDLLFYISALKREIEILKEQLDK